MQKDVLHPVVHWVGLHPGTDSQPVERETCLWNRQPRVKQKSGSGHVSNSRGGFSVQKTTQLHQTTSAAFYWESLL